MHRRQALAGIVGILGAARIARGFAAEDAPRARIGLVVYDRQWRRAWMKQQTPSVDLYEPLTFLKHCRDIGAGGMQAELGVLEADRVKSLRDFAEQQGLFLEGIARPPKDETDVARFSAEIKTAAEVGALAVRTVVMPGRRYEQFKSRGEFESAAAQAQRSLELAAPIVEKHRVRLAVENHKDQRTDERLALFKRISSEFVGACVDTGNSLALLEDAIDTVTALAPWAFSVHLKDQTLSEYADGFLLGDIPLGQGALDLPRMVAVLKQAKPAIRFQLELITRDALQVPCLSDPYWATMSQVPGSDLARTMRMVRRASSKNVQSVSGLPLEKQVALEDANLQESLAYARDKLDL